MKKMFLMVSVLVLSVTTQAQGFKGLGKSLLNGAKQTVKEAVQQTTDEAAQKLNDKANQALGNTNSNTTTSSGNGILSAATGGSVAVSSTVSDKPTNSTVTYVSNAGSNRNDGSKDAPLKDLQKAIEKAPEGSTIRIAEGNYLGYMNAGYVEVNKWLTLEGGWNSNFTERNPLKYITKMEPTKEQMGTNGNKALITLSGLDDAMNYKVNGTVVIDGICFNYGFENLYLPADPKDPKNGCPSEKFETGRMVDNPQQQLQHQIIHSDAAVAGNVIIRNCLMLNSPYFAIQMNSRCGEIEIYNNVIVCNRFGGCRIDGWDKEGTRSHINFHHNTVGFSWCRDKVMEDMGYGYEFQNRINGDVHHNIFFCNNFAAVARTRVDTKDFEAKKVTNLYDNYFFMNKADLQLPSKGGGKWTNVSVADFEDVDEKTLPKADGNKELPEGDSFVNAIDPDYLKAFASMEIISSSSFDRNSAANQYRQAHGLNMQGTETIRVTMYGNRYNFDKALLFFGAKAGYGAQKP